MKYQNPFIILLVLLFCNCITACVCFPGKELKYKYEQTSPSERRPCIDYKKIFYIGPEEETEHILADNSQQYNLYGNIFREEAEHILADNSQQYNLYGNIFREEVDKVFSNSKVLSKSCETKNWEQYHLNTVMFFVPSEHRTLQFVSIFFSALSLTALPGYGDMNAVIIVDVKKGNQILKKYRYDNSWRFLMQFFLFPLTPWHYPPSVARGIIDDMLLQFLHDFEQDKLLY
jgi:hypothetical protein